MNNQQLIENHNELFRLVKKMREAQRRFNRHGQMSDLALRNKYENMVDKIIFPLVNE
jgi:hypothetical protein